MVHPPAAASLFSPLCLEGACSRATPQRAEQSGTRGKTREGQDTFDHDKGQKSAISGKFLHWIFLVFSNGHVPSLQVFCAKKKGNGPKTWRKLPDFRAEKKNLESCHVSGCHGCFGPERGAWQHSEKDKGATGVGGTALRGSERFWGL